MPRLFAAVLLGGLVALAGPAPAAPEAVAAGAPRVVLVGVDGASWSVLDPLLEAGALPQLAALLARGRQAELETVEPVVSPVVWTSIATGRRPEAHGVGGFLATRFDLRVPTMFDRLAADGRRVGLYDWLVGWPPPSYPGGFAIPGWMRRDGATEPPDVWTRAGVAPYVHTYDRLPTRADHAANVRAELRAKPDAWLGLLRAYHIEVGGVIFYALDETSHRFWREAFPGDFGEGPRDPLARPGSLLREAVVGIDAALGRIAAALGPDDVLLVASDHGFRAREGGAKAIWATRLRDQLGRAGLDPERDGFRALREWGIAVFRVLPGPLDARDETLERLRAFLASVRGPEGEALLDVYSVDAAPRPPGSRRPWWERARQQVIRWIASYGFGVGFDEPAHAWVFARPRAAALEALWPDARVRVAGAELPIADVVFRDEFNGEHDPVAVFVAAGGPITHDPERGRISVLDVAPLVAYLAGAPVPDDLDGQLPRAWIRPGWLAAHPPRTVPAAEAPGAAPGGAAPDAVPGDPALREKLRNLGYLE